MITILDDQKALTNVEKQRIKTIASKALNAMQRSADDVTIVLGNDQSLRELNRQFAGNDYATDVLSFSANNLDPETGENYLGDIAISLDHVKKQAEEHQHSFLEELITLIVHGLLHLCGYDHADEITEKEMFALQGEIVADLKENIS